MSEGYDGESIIATAIAIERRGIMFYDVMAKSTDAPSVVAVFEGLSSMERTHLATFEQMLADLERYGRLEKEDTAAEEYLAALVDDSVFNDDLITGEMAAQADSDIKAIELAISAEKDSLLFYYEMRDMLPQASAPLIMQIIDEEKRHLEQLTAIRKSLAEE